MTYHNKNYDRDIESVMGLLLRIGVILSASIVLSGGLFYLFQHGLDLPHYHRFRGEPSTLRNVKQIFQGVIHFQSVSIIQLGLLVLIATPISRIIFSIIGFIIEKDYPYVVITILVLIIIGFSLLGGIAI